MWKKTPVNSSWSPKTPRAFSRFSWCWFPSRSTGPTKTLKRKKNPNLHFFLGILGGGFPYFSPPCKGTFKYSGGPHRLLLLRMETQRSLKRAFNSSVRFHWRVTVELPSFNQRDSVGWTAIPSPESNSKSTWKYIHPWKSRFRTWKPSFFRGALLVLGSVFCAGQNNFKESSIKLGVNINFLRNWTYNK